MAAAGCLRAWAVPAAWLAENKARSGNLKLSLNQPLACAVHKQARLKVPSRTPVHPYTAECDAVMTAMKILLSLNRTSWGPFGCCFAEIAG